MSPSGATGSGESATETVTSASGVWYVVVTEAVLFPSFVSSPVPLTLKNVSNVVSLMPNCSSFAEKTISKSSPASIPHDARLQVKVALIAPTDGSVQLHPAGTVADMKRSDEFG